MLEEEETQSVGEEDKEIDDIVTTPKHFEFGSGSGVGISPIEDHLPLLSNLNGHVLSSEEEYEEAIYPMLEDPLGNNEENLDD